MPHIDINLFPGRSDELKKKVADAVIDTMIEELGCQRNHLSVAMHEVDPADWNDFVAENINMDEIVAGEVYKAE